MQFVDLAAQQGRIRTEIQERIQAVLDHGKYIMGPEVKALEERLAEFAGARHAIACSSGTDALLLALLAYGVGPGDAVFTTPFTFVATAEVIRLIGATPVFVDIDPATFNIDPEKLESTVESLLAKGSAGIRPKGIVPVDLFGLPADYDRINEIAKKRGMFVVEDAAQSFGARYRGKKACALADVGCTSFFPAKPLGCYGDGGMCFTDDDELAKTLRSLAVHGKGDHKYDNVRIGINGRLDTLQAAILLAKFDIFPEEIELRNEVADEYTRHLSGNPRVKTPAVPEGLRSVWAQYSVLAENAGERQRLQAKLKEKNVPTAIYYPKPLHLQTAFEDSGFKEGDFPVSEDFASRIFSLPMHPYLSKAEIERVCSAFGK